MGEQNESIGERELTRDFKSDYDDDLQLGTEWNVFHLSVSKVALNFFSKHKVLRDFKPLVDQISATNHLDRNEREYYKYMVDGQIMELYKDGYGDHPDESRVINIARQYMHNLIDGCKGGYRGKLVTEVRRVYRSERSEGTGSK